DEISLDMGQLCFAGALSGALASLVLTSVELIKCKLQVQETFIYNKSSALNHYQLLNIHLNNMVYVDFTVDIQEHLFEKPMMKLYDINPIQLMIAGAYAGMAYNLFVFPADSIKSQMQTKEKMMQATGKTVTKCEFIRVARDLYKADGIPGFYRGCGIMVARAALSSAIIFMTYA
ncbi:8428_t:CDS:2, partial [Racocetra fulgida]